MKISLVVLIAGLALVGCKPGADAFKQADLDKNGTLSKNETGLALLEAVYAASDADGDARITSAEWQKANPSSSSQAMFEKRDADNDGAVTPEELKAYANSQGSFDKLFAQIDTSGDGQVDRAEARAFHEKVSAAQGATTVEKLSTTANE